MKSLPFIKSSPGLGFVGLLFASFIAAFDAVALSVSLPTIASALHLTTITAYWSATIFVLASAVFQPLFPSISNIIGRRVVTLTALALLILGTIICGVARHGTEFLVGRALQGVGSGGATAMMYVVLADLWDLRKRASMFSINGLVWLVGLAIGPILGGVFSQEVTWRWVFWITLPAAGIATFLVGGFLDIPVVAALGANYSAPSAPLRSLNWSHIDYVGAALLSSALTSVLIPLTWGGVQYAWSSWRTLVPLFLGIAGLCLWVLYSTRRTRTNQPPLIPLRILTSSRTASISFFTIFILGIIQFTLVFFLPLYYQLVKGYSPIICGVALLPNTCLCGPVTMATGVIMTRTGRYKVMCLAGWALLATGSALLTLLSESSTPAQWVFLNVVSTVGIGILFPATSMASQADAGEEDKTVTAGLSPTFRALGQAVGLAASNSLLSNVYKLKLHASSSTLLRTNADFIAENLGSPEVFRLFGAGSPADKIELQGAFNDALHGLWWMLFAISTVALLATIAISDGRLGSKRVESGEVSDSHSPEMNTGKANVIAGMIELKATTVRDES